MASREDAQRSEVSSSHRQAPADEHNYDATMSAHLTFAEFKRRSKPTDAVFVRNVVRNLKPETIGPERLFSFERLRKNHPDRNVFLHKKSPSVL